MLVCSQNFTLTGDFGSGFDLGEGQQTRELANAHESRELFPSLHFLPHGPDSAGERRRVG